MDEALQNILDEIDSLGGDLDKRNYVRFLKGIIEDCELRIEAAEDEADDDEDEDYEDD